MKSWMNIGAIVIALVIGVGSHYYTKKPDGTIEQVAESVLRLHGIDVDLSPE